jgi:uncharacterized protein with PIN domain
MVIDTSAVVAILFDEEDHLRLPVPGGQLIQLPPSTFSVCATM